MDLEESLLFSWKSAIGLYAEANESISLQL
jgi:hypothetical protein